ncbi:MAG: ribonuclease P protein component [Burkholderiales bacterium]
MTANAIEARYCLRGEEPPRLGIAVSRRYAKLATTRNAFKRQVREAFRDCRETLQGVDVIVRLRAPIEVGSRAQQDEIRNLFAELCRERSSC